MINDLLTELCDRGYHLHYLRGPTHGWEASISRPLPQPRDDGYISAVGHGQGATALDALEDALDAVESDFGLLAPQTCDNYIAQGLTDKLESTTPLDITSLLANLRPRVANPFRGRL